MNIMCLRQTHAEFRYADAPGGVPEKLGLVGLRIPRCWRPRVSNLAAVAVIQGLNWVMLRFRGVIQVDGGIIAVRVGQPRCRVGRKDIPEWRVKERGGSGVLEPFGKLCRDPCSPADVGR